MRKLAIAITVALGLVGLASCSSTPSAAQKESQAQNDISSQLVTNQPPPNAPYSQLRQNVIEVENAQIKGVQTTSFFFNQGVQDPAKTCPSIGYPIPVTDSLTNPQQIAGGYAGGGGNYGIGVIGQMDPNGVYGGDSTGTYVMCVNGSGQAVATYWEGHVGTEPSAAVWDEATHSIKDTGPATFHFSTSKGN
jgi:hypothetical protein